MEKGSVIFLVFSSLLFSFHLTHPSIRKRNTFGSKFNFFIERTKFHTDSISNDTPQEIGRSNGRVKPRDILPNYLLPLFGQLAVMEFFTSFPASGFPLIPRNPAVLFSIKFYATEPWPPITTPVRGMLSDGGGNDRQREKSRYVSRDGTRFLSRIKIWKMERKETRRNKSRSREVMISKILRINKKYADKYEELVQLTIETNVKNLE